MSMTCAWRLLAVSLCCAMAVSAPALAGTQTREAAVADWNAEGRHAGLAAPDTQCQDFLQAMGRKPDTLEYLGCEQDDASYIKPMTARYRVRGASAAQRPTCTTRSACLCSAMHAAAGAAVRRTPGVQAWTASATKSAWAWSRCITRGRSGRGFLRLTSRWA
ncbi:DUF4952 domain-containing protein [Stenotrophomonas rhizophila]|uniref:DUF4952 domain-containing protein n=1 Tax=Stenotrophomonas rhizophila TaxID=216778 RepID=UPI0028D1907B|nr:DUF4952 domain-containing protein [Stenotrophomonas rhizophila]